MSRLTTSGTFPIGSEDIRAGREVKQTRGREFPVPGLPGAGDGPAATDVNDECKHGARKAKFGSRFGVSGYVFESCEVALLGRVFVYLG